MSIGSGSKVTGSDGRELTLGELVKSGGAGAIYRVADSPELVAKIYHPHVDVTVYQRKVEAMRALVPDLPDIEEGGAREVQLTWPRSLLRDGRRRFLGYTMPMVDFAASVELECVLQERQARAHGLPTGLGAHVTLAANLAGVIAELHRQGHRVVDLKPVNLRFYRRSLHIAMLDSDGFSIQGAGERFRAPQFTPEYLAPELHGRTLTADDEESQDRFALAVVVFQLLDFGIHPFTGRPLSEKVPTDIAGRIARRCYAYGLRASPDMAPHLASGHTAMPSELRDMFDRAFAGTGGGRPGASEWATLLRECGRPSSGKIIECQTNRFHEHFAGMSCAACARTALLTKSAAQAKAAERAARRRMVRGKSGVAARQRPAASTGRHPWRPKLPRDLILLIALMVVPLLVPWDECSTSGSSGGRSAQPSPEISVPVPRPPAPRPLFPLREGPPATSLDDVLQAARRLQMPALAKELDRLPSAQYRRDEADLQASGQACTQARADWQEKTAWIARDTSFVNDEYLLMRQDWRARARRRVPESEPKACAEVVWLAEEVLRIQELCALRMRWPELYAGPGTSACRSHGVLEAAPALFASLLLHAHAREPTVWGYLGQALLVADDTAKAEAAFVVMAHQVGHDYGHRFVGFSSVLGEPWLRTRSNILAARGEVTVGTLLAEQVSATAAWQAKELWPKEKRPQPTPTRKRTRRRPSL